MAQATPHSNSQPQRPVGRGSLHVQPAIPAPAPAAVRVPADSFAESTSPFGGLGARLHEFTRKEMTRKQFLATSGLALATILGLGGMLRLLGVNNQTTSSRAAHDGYGDLAYGGSQAPRPTASKTTNPLAGKRLVQ